MSTATCRPLAAAVLATIERAGIPHRRDEPLARHTTLGIGGPVPVLLAPRDPGEVLTAIQILGDSGIPYRILGAGSNLLADDDGLDFAVLATAAVARPPSFDGTRVTADAGAFLPQLVRDAGKQGRTGLEFGIGVPGSVGGAVRMNAGAWGSEMNRVVRQVTCVRLVDGRSIEGGFTPAFAYRTAGVPEDVCITRVELELAAGDPELIRATIARYADERRRSQPTAAKSAGCTFRNPPGDSAGRLIDAAGLKGLRRGGAEVSTRHGNFVVNRGGASADDVRALIAEVRERVRERFAVQLREEVVSWRGRAIEP